MKTYLSRILLILALAVSALLSSAANADPILWGTSSFGTHPSSLFTIDAATGAATLVGSTTLGNKISAIAVDPVDGTLYAILGSACSGARLITINPMTGAGTLVGVLTGSGFDGSSTVRCIGGSDALEFGRDGTLYAGGWNGGPLGGKLLVVDKTTGAVTLNFTTDIIAPDIRPAHIAGMATASDGTIWVSRGNNTPGTLHTIDPTTGGFLITLTLSDGSAILSDIAFADGGTLYASNPSTGQLVTVDTTSGMVTPVGLFGGEVKISGLTSMTVEVPAEDCAEPGGCDLVGITVELGPGAVFGGDATVSARTVVVDDDESLCGVEDRFFDVMGTTTDTDDFVLRKEICGAPRFAIKIIETTGITFPSGVVEITTDPSEFFENARPCQAPIPQLPPAVDPREQDIVYWQTTDRTLMLKGKGEETTKDCGGSSRGFVRFLSYFGIGTYYFFRADNGPELNWIGNPESVEQAFIDITRVKLDDLEEATENAMVALPKKGDRKKLQQMIKNAVKLFGRGNFEGSLGKLKNYRKFVDRATFDTSLTFNHNGELRWRVDNAIFMHEVKVIPFAP